jgi:hypothetical protein
MSDAAYIGLDLGGTFLKGARIDPTGKVLARLHEPVRKATTPELLTQLAGAVETLEKGAGPVLAVGVGLPGIVEMTRGRVRSSPNVPALDGLKVGEELEAGIEEYAVELLNPDFACYARSCGGVGIRVEHQEDLDDAVRIALESDLPALVEVLTDPSIHPTPTLPAKH